MSKMLNVCRLQRQYFSLSRGKEHISPPGIMQRHYFTTWLKSLFFNDRTAQNYKNVWWKFSVIQCYQIWYLRPIGHADNNTRPKQASRSSVKRIARFQLGTNVYAETTTIYYSRLWFLRSLQRGLTARLGSHVSEPCGSSWCWWNAGRATFGQITPSGVNNRLQAASQPPRHTETITTGQMPTNLNGNDMKYEIQQI